MPLILMGIINKDWCLIYKMLENQKVISIVRLDTWPNYLVTNLLKISRILTKISVPLILLSSGS